jgi:hypothetical protein
MKKQDGKPRFTAAGVGTSLRGTLIVGALDSDGRICLLRDPDDPHARWQTLLPHPDSIPTTKDE